MKLNVDGEIFTVTEKSPSEYEYTWVSGPNEGYGFGANVHGGAPHEGTIREFHVERIRNFLSMIDPQTGFIAALDE